MVAFVDMKLSGIVPVVVVGLASPFLARADLVNLTSAADASLVESAPDNNTGSNSFVAAGASASTGPRRGLFLFDVAGAIPAGSIINSATLTLTVPEGNIANPSTFDLFRVLGDWTEGDKVGSAGSPADTGEVTWNSRHHGVTLWNSPGGDFIGTASASAFVSGLGTYTWSSAALAADVQWWLDNSATNFGWILISQSEGTPQTARRFGSREDPLNAPVLSIDFTIIPEPSALCLTALGALSFLGLASIRVRARTARDPRACAAPVSQRRAPDGPRRSSR